MLKNINKDIIGWIEIEDTNINYPILKDDSNLKYLKHSYDDSFSTSGSIFTITKNPFEENITTIYGHNMKTGLMFSDLGKYMNRNFLYKHQVIYIYTENKDYKATIFSVYSGNIFEEEDNIENLSFEEEIKYYEKSSKYLVDNIEKSKKILKLSTCSYLNNRTVPTTQRYFIVAFLEEIN
ncbi:MAG: class B sortase [Clostridia bacterium]|nr:class B sortase [Clostridia bacterium]